VKESYKEVLSSEGRGQMNVIGPDMKLTRLENKARQ
jgi:hypothetical protein